MKLEKERDCVGVAELIKHLGFYDKRNENPLKYFKQRRDGIKFMF